MGSDGLPAVLAVEIAPAPITSHSIHPWSKAVVGQTKGNHLSFVVKDPGTL